MSDRTVHAVMADGLEVVRYDRAGKWYLEGGSGRLDRNRWRRISLAEAVELAKREGSRVFIDLPGGSAFDRMVSK